MKRAIAVSAGTIAGLAAVLALNPDDPTVSAAGQVPTAATPSPSNSADSAGGSAGSSDSAGSAGTPDSGVSPGATQPGTTTAPSPSSSPTAGPDAGGSTGTPGAAAAASGTFTGTAVSVRNFGVIQVQITTDNGRITAIEATQVPDWDRKSEMISSYSVPELVSQALDAQSADIAGISGATFTSVGFSQSLQAAMAKAGLG